MSHTRTITLELLLAGEGLSGRAYDGDGGPREFSGRLGLMHTIDELLAEAGSNKEDEMSPMEILAPVSEASALRRLIGGTVIGPGDEGWDAARQAFNLRVDQRPAMIAEPGGLEEVAVVVDFPREAGLRVVPQRPGHNADPLGPLAETILLKTTRLDRVQIDARSRCARVGSGARWEDVVPAASAQGLAALHGSTPDVSVAGYSLGGGMGWYAASTGSPPTASPRSRSSPPTAPCDVSAPGANRSCSGPCAGAAATSASSPRWSSTSTRSRRSMPASSSSPSSAARRC